MKLFQRTDKARKRNKVTLSVTISPELYDWILYNCKNKVFQSRSHAVEYCLFTVMNGSKEE